MKATKIVIKILISLAIPALILYFLDNFIFQNVFPNVLSISSDSQCCGLIPGSMVRWKKLNPSTLQHGDVVFYKDSNSKREDTFSRVVAFPGEYLFSDLHTGKRGYYSGEIEWKKEMTKSEISNLFSKITWLDTPIFQETIPSENLYDRLRLISNDTTKYQLSNENYKKSESVETLDPMQVYGVYDSVFLTADNVTWYGWIMIIIYLLLVAVTYDILPRIFIKLKKNEPRDSSS